MAGAFVAVADDATSTWWNPAGLATGPYMSGIVEHGRAPGEAGQERLGIAFAVPSLGLSYYRLRISAIPPSGSTGSPGAGRQDQGTTGTRLPANVLSQFGATVGQSLGEHLVVGTTLKLLLADQTRGDLDVGAMASFGSARVAVAVKNVREAELTAGGLPVPFGRQVRVGGAYSPRLRGTATMVAAFDADLTRTLTADGDERHLAGGLELWLRDRVGVRGGIEINTLGAARPSFSGGASAALRQRLYVDAQVTQGEDEATKGCGLALRVAF